MDELLNALMPLGKRLSEDRLMVRDAIAKFSQRVEFSMDGLPTGRRAVVGWQMGKSISDVAIPYAHLVTAGKSVAPEGKLELSDDFAGCTDSHLGTCPT